MLHHVMWCDLMLSCVSMWCSVKNGILMPCDALCCDVMPRYDAVQYITIWCEMKCSAFRSEEMWCNAMQYDAYVICCYAMRSDVIGCNSVHVQFDMSVTNVIQCDAMWFTAMQCNAMIYDMMQCCTIHCNTIWCHVIKLNAIDGCDVLRCDPVQYNTMECVTMRWDLK